MRMAFGLAGVLVALGVVVWILSAAYLPHTQAVLKEGKKGKDQVSQMAGVDARTGMRTQDSITMNPVQSGGRLDGILVTAIVAGGPMENYFGLKRNDVIVEVGPQRVRDINDAELAMALILEAYQRRQPLGVSRGGPTIALPQAPGANPGAYTSPPVAAPAPSNPAVENTTPADSRNSLRRQLDQIPGIQTH